MERIKAIDLCSGGGGWACAARGLPIDIVAAVDLWDAACETYRLNHPATEVICGDLRSFVVRKRIVAIARERGVSLVVGGIPCEWLSIYRILNPVKKQERDDQRKTLDSCLLLIKEIAPRWWCLEDVKQLLKELPPMTPYQEINARHFSAQRRKRIFVGEFPATAKRECPDVLRDRLRAGPFRIGRRSATRTPTDGKSFSRDTTLACHPSRKSPTVMEEGSRRDAEKVIVDDRLRGGKRQFEWQECATLQGFPDDYVFYGSPSDVSKMIGRAIQIDTGRAILQAICNEAEIMNGPTITAEDAIQSLGSHVCPACGGPKKCKMTFCGGDYHSLPKPLKNALYCRVGHGYEPAVSEAMAFLGRDTFRMPED